jgi:hypothetical protein
MVKNGIRFFVGHICGAHIYGEDFERITPAEAVLAGQWGRI